MVSKAQNVLKTENPTANMSHLSALVGIKVANKTPGDIVVNDVAFSIPDVWNDDGTAVTTPAELIVGEFNVGFSSNGNLTFEPRSETNGDATTYYAYPTAHVALKDGKSVTIEPEGDATFYLAVRPLSVSAKSRKISIKINGSERQLLLDNPLNLESGKVTTFKVSVNELTSPQVTNSVPSNGKRPFTSTALRDDNNTYDILTVSGTKIEGGLIINGKQVDDVYQIGTTNGGVGKIVLEGYAKDMINALPISFNVSSMDNEPAAMTVSLVDAKIPQYRSSYGSILSPNKKDYTKSEIYRKTLDKHSVLGSPLAGKAVVKLLEGLGVTLSNGLSREELVNFANGNTITFNNLPTNGYFANGNVVVLDETNTNKSIQTGTIDYFLGEKLSYGDYLATHKGLWAILNATYEQQSDGTWGFSYSKYTELDKDGNTKTYDEATMKDYAEKTAQSMLARVGASLDSRGLGLLTSAIADNYVDLMHILRETKLKIEISNYPYKYIYPEKEHLETGYKPIIIWGLNASLQ